MMRLMRLARLARLKRLATHEDAAFFHVHKILGVFVLSHFAYRLCYETSNELGFADASYADLAAIVIHALLHVSSFQFALPLKRNFAYNTIWPEMRMHSLIFAWRSVAVLLLLWCFRRGLISSDALFASRCIVIIAAMAFADLATRRYRRLVAQTTQKVSEVGEIQEIREIQSQTKSTRTTTMRDNAFPEGTPTGVRYIMNTFYSISQLIATLMLLVRGEGAAFLILLPIQIAPLLMTLEKKGFITSVAWHVGYSLALGLNFVYNLSTVGQSSFQIGVMCILLRLGFRVNKYAMWGLVFYALCADLRADLRAGPRAGLF